MFFFSFCAYVCTVLKILLICLDHLLRMMIRRLLSTIVECAELTADFLPHAVPSKIPSTFGVPHLESLDWLYTAAPCFPVAGSKISIINEPKDFYDTLLAKSATAKRRIYLTSLYLGTGELEQNLVATVLQNLRTNKDLSVNILLDFTRGTRGEENSQTTLMPLVRETTNFRLSLYHTPVLRGLTKRLAPPRWNELIGLQHMKIYLFDDTVIVSGANLSKDYFTNRQDRYVMIEDSNLADFYSDMIGKVQEFSLCVDEEGNANLHESWNMLPYESAQVDFAQEAKDRIWKHYNKTMERQKLVHDQAKETDTWVFPMVEMGQLGIHHDSVITKRLLSSSLDESKIRLATGYFNLTQNYMDTITNDCQANCNILMAHPNANGFQGAKGPAGGIPAAYTLIAKKFYQRLVDDKQHHRVSLSEYERPGWTYHAKGLWYYLPGTKLPSLTVIGSSNFGERSVNRDLETQVCLVTHNRPLQQQLQGECDHLYKYGRTAEVAIVARPVPKWVKAVVGLFKNFF